MLALSETHCRADQPSVLPPIPGYTIFNTERSGADKGGGGLSIVYRDSLVAHQWLPSVLPEYEFVKNERQWLLLNSQAGSKCAFLHCYIACQSFTSDSFIEWNESLFKLITSEAIQLRRQGFAVVSMGDFNTRVGQLNGLEGNKPDTNRNFPMFMTFISEVNLFILNTLPLSKGLFTRFMGGHNDPEGASLLDYGLIDGDHVGNVCSFAIDDQARFDCGSDHALLECEILLDSQRQVQWAFHDVLQYNFNDNSDFSCYQKHLDDAVSSLSLTEFSKLDSAEMLSHLCESYSSSAKKAFGLKMKGKRKQRTSLPKDIISKIQVKNYLSRSINSAFLNQSPQYTADQEQELATLKMEIRNSISDFKLKKRHRLRSKLLRADPTRKRFWRFLKNQIKAAGQITALYKVTREFFYPNSMVIVKWPIEENYL